MWILRPCVLFVALALCATPAAAELVISLKDEVKALMTYEAFPSVEQAMSLIADDDPLVEIKRSEVLYTLISLESHYPIDVPGKWDDLEKTYKRAFKERGFRWPLSKTEKAQLEAIDFSAYELVMKRFFPEALKLKPSADGSHKEEQALRMVVMTFAGRVILLLMVLVARLVTPQSA